MSKYKPDGTVAGTWKYYRYTLLLFTEHYETCLEPGTGFGALCNLHDNLER
jgi:hypothetical protein